MIRSGRQETWLWLRIALLLCPRWRGNDHQFMRSSPARKSTKMKVTQCRGKLPRISSTQSKLKRARLVKRAMSTSSTCSSHFWSVSQFCHSYRRKRVSWLWLLIGTNRRHSSTSTWRSRKLYCSRRARSQWQLLLSRWAVIALLWAQLCLVRQHRRPNPKRKWSN